MMKLPLELFCQAVAAASGLGVFDVTKYGAKGDSTHRHNPKTTLVQSVTILHNSRVGLYDEGEESGGRSR